MLVITGLLILDFCSSFLAYSIFILARWLSYTRPNEQMYKFITEERWFCSFPLLLLLPCVPPAHLKQFGSPALQKQFLTQRSLWFSEVSQVLAHRKVR